MTQTDPRDPDLEDPDQVRDPDDAETTNDPEPVRNPDDAETTNDPEPVRNPDEPQE